MPQAGDTTTYTGVDGDGNPVTQTLYWDPAIEGGGGWSPNAPAPAQTTPDAVYGQYGNIGGGLQGALNAFVQSSGADPTTALQAADAYVNTYGLSTTENPYDLAQKIIRGTDWGSTANQYKEPFISNMFADPGVQAVGQQVQQAWQAQNQPDTWLGGLSNAISDAGPIANLAVAAAAPEALPWVLGAEGATQVAAGADPLKVAGNLALSYGLSQGLGSLGGAGDVVDIGGQPVDLPPGNVMGGQQLAEANIYPGPAYSPDLPAGISSTGTEAVDPQMLQAYKDAGLLAQDAVDFSSLSQPMAYTPSGGVIQASDLSVLGGAGDVSTGFAGRSAGLGGVLIGDTTGAGMSGTDFLGDIQKINSLQSAGQFAKLYPGSVGAALGFLKSGNLAGALAGASLGSGIGGLYNSYNAPPGSDTNWVSSGLKTGLGLLGLASTPSTGLLGKPLGAVFGGTAAPGAGGAGVGAGGAGSAGAGLPGTIRPYQFTQIRNPNWGKPGEPYFLQQYSAQPTFRAANGGQIPDLDNMYPQSSIDHSSYATPLQRPMQQAVVSSGYGPRLNPFTGEEQMAGGGLADLTPTYAAGGRLLRGPGDGVSDSIPAVISGKQPQRAALADGEFVLPARIVSEIGNGSTEAGARKLYAMMDRIQKRRGSTLKNVAADTRAEKLLPA
jgi:hypothetical protein